MQRALLEMELSWLRERYNTVTILSLSQNACYTFIARFAFQLPRSRVPIVISCVCGEIARPLTLRNSRAKHQDWFVLECNTMCIVIRTERRLRRLIVDLSSAPLLWDGLILVQDVRGHVIQVLPQLTVYPAFKNAAQSRLMQSGSFSHKRRYRVSKRCGCKCNGSPYWIESSYVFNDRMCRMICHVECTDIAIPTL